MRDDESEKEKEFLVTGARTYLDVDDAMIEFRRQIQDQCRAVVCSRLAEINRACNRNPNWTHNDVKTYFERFTGDDCLYVGCRLDVEGFGGLYFCLKLAREEDSRLYHAVANLYRQNQSIAAELWGSFGEDVYTSSSKGPNNLFFAQGMSENDVPDLRERLNLAADDLIAFIDGSGDLKKYLGQGKPSSQPGSLAPPDRHAP